MIHFFFLHSFSFLRFESELGAKRLLFLLLIASSFPDHTSGLLNHGTVSNFDLLILADVGDPLALEVGRYFIELIDNSSLLLLLRFFSISDVSSNLIVFIKQGKVILLGGGGDSRASISGSPQLHSPVLSQVDIELELIKSLNIFWILPGGPVGISSVEVIAGPLYELLLANQADNLVVIDGEDGVIPQKLRVLIQ